LEINKEYQDLINLERGRALDTFAKLESTLCWVLAEVGNLEFKIASTIFYSNIFFQPRIEIISAIIESAYGNRFKIFWTSTCKILNSLNKQRNKIVHWHSYPVYEKNKNSDKKDFENTKFILIHPIIKGPDDKLSELSSHNIEEFIKKTQYVTQVLNRFRHCFDKTVPILTKQEIKLFSENELKYPPDKNDPFKK